MGWLTYPFTNFNGATFEIWELITTSTPYFTGHVNTYPYWDERLSISIKRDLAEIAYDYSDY